MRLDSYTREFAERFEDQDIFAWLRSFGLRKREEMEAKIPTLAEAVEAIEKIARKRAWDADRPAREEAEAKRRAEYEAKWEEERKAAFLARKFGQTAKPEAKQEPRTLDAIETEAGFEYTPINPKYFQ